MDQATETDVLIVGGGPVGLLLGNLLGQLGIQTVILERRPEPLMASMAIGITPPSLEILRKIGLDKTFVRNGFPVRTAKVIEDFREVGCMSFDGLCTPYPFFLSIPQCQTRALLFDQLKSHSSITCHTGVEFKDLEDARSSIKVRAWDYQQRQQLKWSARYVVASDGYRSSVRAACGIPVKQYQYPQRWIMADYPDHGECGVEARLYFGPHGSIESFPLPGGQRRWIAQSEPGLETPTEAHLHKWVEDRTGISLDQNSHNPPSCFGAKFLIAKDFNKGRVFLCGDAAHVMSSVGGQGMNTGFADAELLTHILHKLLESEDENNRLAQHYKSTRLKAFHVAANRAARGMWLGTIRGRFASAIRGQFIQHVLFSSLMKPHLAPYFAMLTIPHRNLEHTPSIDRLLITI